MSNLTTDFTETQYKAIPGQISTNDAKGIVECFVAAIGNKDSVGDICLPGCFNGSLNRRKPRVVWGHNWNEPIGKVLEVYEVGPNDPRLPTKMKSNGVGGLFAKVQFNLASERGREAFANVKFFGDEQEWSIGYKTLDAVFDTSRQANMLKEVELYEISPVLHGANQLTGTISIKSDKENSDGKSTSYDPKEEPTTKGANLKPGVKGPVNASEKMRRKGSFLIRFFTNPSGPMKDEKGKPTRLALSAAAWGEPIPQDKSDTTILAAKGQRMLEDYQNSKKKLNDIDAEEKNIQIYSIANPLENPTIGRMGALAKAISTHFGGEVAVREADNNSVVFDLSKDGKLETMRAAYHTPNESDFMFGPAQQVRVEIIYLPVNSNGEVSGGPVPKSPNMLTMPKSGGCGCDGTCGGKSNPFASWQEFKSENPGVHLFIKTENMEMYEVANNVSEYHGFDVELLSDGFVIPNIDWYEKDARDAVLTAVEGVEQKAFARIARNARSIGRRARRLVDPAEFDGDSDGFVTGREGIDNVPYKPDIDRLKPRMMPPRTVPEEVPKRTPKRIPIPKPIKVPEPVPKPAPVPNPSPLPLPPEREPERPKVPTGLFSGVSGRMSSSVSGKVKRQSILRQLREMEMDPSNPSGVPKRAKERAIAIIAKANKMTEAQARRALRRELAVERMIRAARMMKNRRKSLSSVYVSVSEGNDIAVKTALQSTMDSPVFIEVEPQFVTQIKQVVDTVANFHGVRIDQAENGINVFGAHELTDDSIEAISRAIYATYLDTNIEEMELDRIFRQE